jgi:hypothetical protein
MPVGSIVIMVQEEVVKLGVHLNLPVYVNHLGRQRMTRVYISARTADAGQRNRKQRVLSNVAKLGEISAIESKSMGEAVAELNLIGEDNSHILYEPKNYKESLDSPQSREWRGARTREKDSLYKRKVMSWHRAPKGAKILKST